MKLNVSAVSGREAVYRHAGRQTGRETGSFEEDIKRHRSPDVQGDAARGCSAPRRAKERNRRHEDRVRSAEHPAAEETADRRGAAVDLLLPGSRYTCLSVCTAACLSVCTPLCSSVNHPASVQPFVCLNICLCACLSVYLLTCLIVCHLSVSQLIAVWPPSSFWRCLIGGCWPCCMLVGCGWTGTRPLAGVGGVSGSGPGGSGTISGTTSL